MNVNRDLPHTPTVRRPLSIRLSRSVIVAAASIALLCGLALPANADELDDRKEQLKVELAQQAGAVADAHNHHSEAAAALVEARAQLAAAEARLDAAEAEARAAAAEDKKRAEELEVAEHKLKQAEADVAAAIAALNSVNKRINEEIMVTTQTTHGLLNLALIFSDVNTTNLNQRAQLAETLFDSSAQQLDELEMRRLALEDAQLAAEAARTKADEARQAAAEQLKIKEAAEAEAQAIRGDMAGLVQRRDAAEAAARQQVAVEEQQQRDLVAENASVEKRIQERIAREKAEAAAKAERERIAAEKAKREADAKAAAERKAQADREAREAREAAAQRDSRSTPRVEPAKPAPKPVAKPKPVASSSSGFIMPSGARITSRYGMRLHPVLGYWKLHDGTDFGASCGSPIRAASDGVVSERYYNAGYGNRLMIDHGRVDGNYVTTGYNHATRYIVGVGQRVSKGQTIGYVGSTGYSTGCHLHYSTWANGQLADPISLF
ncbi:MAG TPA: M23 family metallopeptidase [Tessaracoccus flavescens]|uniref:M23 family metallopeptidase n=1 Tax=Tessaracoccus flavescens TaxID=399497 RepID=A0A921EL54_9ACTN|nr:M23 family metallopeptidase [Tessaracoccus flavescens]